MATPAALAEARQLLAERARVVTLAGPLHERVQAADVDPADTAAEPEAGEAAAEELVTWCDAHGLPWLLRASGRAGGRHVLAVVPAELVGPWRELCTRAGRTHEVGVSPRRTLRLLSAPHRHGLAAPVLAATLRPQDLPEPPPEAATSTDASEPRPRRRRRGARSSKRAGVDRSRREFGDALAHARAGNSARTAWQAANTRGSKAHEMGEPAWRRWVWSRAVTIVAAEQGISEDAAWRQFAAAAPRRARSLGREGWRTDYWASAQAEATTSRPRRAHTTPDSATAGGGPADPHELAVLRLGLREACDQQISLAGRRPQFARSVAAVLDALAGPIATREGSMSERGIAEAARLARSTVRDVLAFALERGILARTRAYVGGSADSAAYQPGPAAAALIAEHRKTQTTRWYTPPAPHQGHAKPERMRRRHARERQLWRHRCELSDHTEATGESYAQSQHPAAKALRSLWHQRRWWCSLTPQQRAERRTHRRRVLGEMHRTERSAWLDWLNRRATLEFSAKRIQQRQHIALDHELLAAAPRTLHLGMRDPQWRTGGSPPQPAGPKHETVEEPQLQAA